MRNKVIAFLLVILIPLPVLASSDPPPTFPRIDWGDTWDDYDYGTPVPIDFGRPSPTPIPVPDVYLSTLQDEPTPDPFSPDITPVPNNAPVSTGLAMCNYFTMYRRESGITYIKDSNITSVAPAPSVVTTNRPGYFNVPSNFSVTNAFLDGPADTLYTTFSYQFATSLPIGSSLSISYQFSTLRAYYTTPPFPAAAPDDLPITVTFLVTPQSGFTFPYSFSRTLGDLYQGITFDLDNVKMPIRSVSLYCMITNISPDLTAEDPAPPQIYFRNTNLPSANGITVALSAYNGSDHSTEDAIASQTNTIGGFFGALWRGIVSIFVPDGDTITAWVQSKSVDIDPASAADLPRQFTIRLFDIFSANYSGPPPPLDIPSLSITTGGQTYQYFDGFTFHFTSIPPVLRDALRTVGDVGLTLGLISYLYKLVGRIYMQKYANAGDDGGDEE